MCVSPHSWSISRHLSFTLTPKNKAFIAAENAYGGVDAGDDTVAKSVRQFGHARQNKSLSLLISLEIDCFYDL